MNEQVKGQTKGLSYMSVVCKIPRENAGCGGPGREVSPPNLKKWPSLSYRIKSGLITNIFTELICILYNIYNKPVILL